jgi:hypothetical protein
MKSTMLMLVFLAGCAADSVTPNVDGGPTGTVPASGALLGTWDVTQTAMGSSTPTTYTVTVTSGSVSVTYGGTTVTLAPDGSGTKLTWTPGAGTPSVITSTHSGSGNSGELPIGVIGDWIFTEAGKGNLTASVTPTTLTTTCTSCGNSVLGSGFKGNLTGVKTPPASGGSIFGDLAGMWQITDDSGAKFTAALIGSALQASFTQAGSSTPSFSVSATLSGNLLSGSTTKPAVEFTARRR